MTLIQTGLNLKGGFVPSEQHVQSILQKSTTCKSRTHSGPRMEKLSQIRKREYISFFVVFPNIISSLELFLWMCGNSVHFILGMVQRNVKFHVSCWTRSSLCKPLRHFNFDPLMSVHLRQVGCLSDPCFQLSSLWDLCSCLTFDNKLVLESR